MIIENLKSLTSLNFNLKTAIFNGQLFPELQDLVIRAVNGDKKNKAEAISIITGVQKFIGHHLAKKDEDFYKLFVPPWNQCLSEKELFERIDVLLTLTLQAIENPKEFNEIDFGANKKSDAPFDKYRQIGTKRTLLGQKGRILKIPVVFTDNKNDRGVLALLILEFLEKTSEENDLLKGVFQHPIDFYTEAKEDFNNAMINAWFAAQKMLPAHTTDSFVSWRLLDYKEQQPILCFEGSSTSAAAALGLYHLYNSTFPDKEVIVLGEIDNDGGLIGVDGIKQKICAIVESQDFDTIVVASKENQNQARDCLNGIGNTSIVVRLLE
jgi:hypothetical protein